MKLNAELFHPIETQKPADLIIEQIQERIAAGVLKRGMKLPSERELASQFNVGRGPVREALKRLEFYGLVRSESQRGYFIAELGEKALQGLIASLLRGARHDLESLLEAREILEVNVAILAAKRAEPSDLSLIRQAHEDFTSAVRNGGLALDEDHVFHLEIARTSKNPVLISLLGYLTPEIIKENLQVSRKELQDKSISLETIKEHELIVDAICQMDADKASVTMQEHMEKMKQRRLNYRERINEQ